ncbi:MAG TPA: hypothetical protein VGF38_11180 [Ktedonobacterales bacterium]
MRTVYSGFSRPLIFVLLSENYRIYEHGPEKDHGKYYHHEHLDIVKHGGKSRRSEQPCNPTQEKHAGKRLIRNDCGTATKLRPWRR